MWTMRSSARWRSVMSSWVAIQPPPDTGGILALGGELRDLGHVDVGVAAERADRLAMREQVAEPATGNDDLG